LTITFDPNVVDTYDSCNPEIGLVDINYCQTAVFKSIPSLQPIYFFNPKLIEGTIYPIAGFPSLTTLPGILHFFGFLLSFYYLNLLVQGCKAEFAKVNMFGSDSKYKSLIVELKSLIDNNFDNLNPELLLGRKVYVNYPQTHEALVMAVSR
jgi:5'-3' exoribonuclease 1